MDLPRNAKKECLLVSDQLCSAVKPTDIEENYQLSIPIDLVGQERAQKALNVALSSEESRFHVLVVAQDIPLEVIAAYVQTQIAKRKEQGETFRLFDYCYVYNFKDPSSPVLICFPAGKGKEFKQMLSAIRENLRRDLPYAAQQLELLKPMLCSPFVGGAMDEAKKLWQSFESSMRFRDLREKGLRARFDQSWRLAQGLESSIRVGISVQASDGKRRIVYSKEEIKNFLEDLTEAERSDYREALMELDVEVAAVQQRIQAIYLRYLKQAEEKIDLETKVLYREAISGIFRQAVDYQHNDANAREFLNGLEDYVLDEIIDLFLPQYQQQTMMGAKGPVQQMQQVSFEELRAQMQMEMNQDPLVPFQINIFVDNGGNVPPPVIVETAATYTNLFGKIETSLPMWQRGSPITDHTKLLPGSFHKANGGFLILNLNDLLFTKPTVYLALKRTLHEKKIRIQDPSEEVGIASGLLTLFPEPMNMELKVIALVKHELYHLLWNNIFHRELAEKFRIVALCDPSVQKTKDTVNAYAAWMKSYAERKSLRCLTREATAEILNHLTRRAGVKNQMDCDIELIKTLLRESHFYSEAEGTRAITAEHVRKAVAEKIHRSNLTEEKFRQVIQNGQVRIEITGKQIGQVNGLVVYSTDDYRFGMPTRITVTTYRGAKGLINIQKEAKLSGNMLVLGTEILQGFFYERYSREKPVGFEGRIVFEQSYGLIDGPSATAAQLLALLSSLSQKPISQSIAITGTVDQKGNIGAIGGVNEKIEGFFEICKAAGLTGEQGVIIPSTNIQHLMLPEEVKDAVQSGQFSIYAISTIDEGVKILMDCQMSKVDALIKERLQAWNANNNNKKD